MEEQKVKLSKSAIDHLIRSVLILTERKQFYCYGIYFYQLNKAGLVDDEMLPTPYGRRFTMYCLANGYEHDQANNL